MFSSFFPTPPLLPRRADLDRVGHVFLLWFQVQLDVMINGWFGTFYNMVQQALGKPGSVSLDASISGRLASASPARSR